MRNEPTFTIHGEKTRVRSWYLLQIIPPRASDLRSKLAVLWGVDVFVWRVPLVKLLLAIEVLILELT